MEQLETIASWLSAHQTLILLVASLSLVLFVAVLVALPLVIVLLPSDYFLREEFTPPADSSTRGLLNRGRLFRRHHRHPLVMFAVLVFKNLFGLIFLLVGFILLFMPGQGLLTIFAGLLLLNFPGKRRLELVIIRKTSITRAATWIRAKAGKPPFALPNEPN